MEDLIKLLINSNLKLVAKETGIPYDRMYKWVKGKATPKTNDYNTLLNYFNELNNSAGNTSNKDNELSQKSNIASKAINNLLGNNPVENSDITLREPGEVNQRSNFHLGGGGGSVPTHSKELLQLIDNQQKQIDLLYQNADLLRSQVALLNNLVARQ